MQVAGDHPQRQMGNLPGQFNHGGPGIEDNGVPGLDQRRRRAGDGIFFLLATLGFLLRGRLCWNKPVEGHAAVRSADHPFLIELNQVAANGRGRGVGHRHQLVHCHQIMALEIIHNLL